MPNFIDKIPIEANGGVPVNMQDQHTADIDWYFRELLNTVTLSNTVTLGAYTCTLAANHNMVNGNAIIFKEGSSFFQAFVLNVNSNVITIDHPFDFAFTSSAYGERCNVNMAVDGSSTPRIFYTSPVGLTNVELDYTKIHFYIEDNTAMTGATFGGLTALSRGITIRTINGINKVHFNIKKNGEFRLHCDSVEFDDKASGSNVWSISAIKRFAGQENQGISIRLSSESSDQLQIIIQDNLTGLNVFHATAQGHAVTE
jgi:hypothetical protein